MISILIPVYNFNIVALVKELHSQCIQANVPFEILVLDDTSDLYKSENRVINDLKHCQYIESTIHFGRAKIRNELGKKAQYENLLFIDADALVDSPDFIQNYLNYKDQAQVIIGGMKYSAQPPKENALRWYYGSKREYLPATVRNQNPYRSLISFNIMVKQTVFSEHPFDEGSIDVEKSEYGHEDTLLGLLFKKHNVSVLHIDNQLVHDYHETNAGFLANSLIAVEKYVNNPQFRAPEVVEQIKIFKVFEKMKRYRLTGFLSFIFKNGERSMKKKLFKSNPSLRLFDFYRLSYLANYSSKNKH